MAFFDKVLGVDDREKKLKQEINSLELRKESVFSAIDGEISRLNRERSNILLAAGTAAYETWCKDSTSADLTDFWGKIQELDKAIVAQETKKTEMGTKYDEEIRLINSNLGISNTVSGLHCPKCNIAISDHDLFCQNCGAKLK